VSKPIEQVALGDRVPGENPLERDDERFGREVDPPTWRRVDLRCGKRDGSIADVSLLRPAWWVEREGVVIGATMQIVVPECGIDGHAEVLAVGPCPVVRPGPGNVVTGTFRHHGAAVIELYVEGLDTPIGTTPNHKFWSDTRRAFVRADSLRPGELLRAGGTARAVVQVVPAIAGATVFNLETYPTHVYTVSHVGLLVHNTDPETLARIQKAAGDRARDLKVMDMPASGRVPIGNGNPGVTYILVDEKSGQILKVGLTGGVNAESRFTQYQTWAKLESAAWKQHAGWEAPRSIKIYYLEFTGANGAYGAADTTETALRRQLESMGERLPWDFKGRTIDSPPIKPKEFGGTSKNAPSLKDLPPRC
jgi:hypothetical protein